MNGAAAAAWADSLAELSLPLADMAWPGSWTRRGACRTTPPWVFFPAQGDSLDTAKGVCSRCPVRQECADYAVPHADLRGIWGGLSEAERRRLRASVPPSATSTAPLGPTQSPRGSLYRTLEELSAHPGRWARVVRYVSPESASASASLLRNGRRSVPPGGWEFEAILNEVGGSDLYAHLRPDAGATDLCRAS